MTCPGPARAVALTREAERLYGSGRYAEAADRYREALAASPDAPGLHTALGAVLHRLGHLQEAAAVLGHAVALDAESAAAHDNLGVVLRLLGHTEKSLEHHRRALQIDPCFARAHANYGVALERTGRRAEAEEAYRAALRLDVSMAAPLVGLGRIHSSRAQYAEAEEAFRRALAVEPRRITAITGLAGVLSATGRHPQALRLCRKAVRLAPDDIQLQLALAGALSAAARDHEALSLYRRLERAGGASVHTLFGKASTLSNLGRYRAADRYYRQGLAACPESAGWRSAYLFALHASTLKGPVAMLRELKKWERLHGAPAALRGPRRRRDPDPDRPLRIGYISPDFRLHVVRQFFEPVMRVHDTERFEFYCYAEVARPDYATETLRAVADRWYDIHGVSDSDVAAQIDRDRIDILVDLAGHTANHRLGVMSHRPAPVQATYLGYFGSSGLSTIDYWITDEVLHPPDTPEPATETIYRLPRCAFCYGVPTHARANPDRASVARPVTFGCFNNVSKVSLEVVDTWAEILGRSGDARLVLKDRRFAFAAVRRTWLRRFERRGIPRERIELLPGSPHDEYMRAYNDIDIALDPFPRTGGTTTCDALWMGVPVVTLVGERYVERLSAAKLSAVGADELITASVDAYVDQALTLAADSALRTVYHQTLRRAMAASPLCDPLSLARALED
ncbi:MAG TPA: tetratricopeptide repeat protein, partial [Arenicellales bacterium]|nr:tetratricopeptide repeat protein [Arenicellales bacterium]